MQESCPFCDVKEGVFRSGENWTDSKDPCLSYLCDQGQVVERRVQCTKIEKCSDGNAPFHMAGECCLSCCKGTSRAHISPVEDANAFRVTHSISSTSICSPTAN